MHVTVEPTIRLMTSRHRAVVTGVADRIPAGIRLPTRKAPRQISKSIKLLIIKSSIMACDAAIVRACAAKVVIVTELRMSKPRIDRLHWSDGRIDSLTAGIPIDDWLWPGSMRSMLSIAEDTLKRRLLQIWQYACQTRCASRVSENHQFLCCGAMLLQYFSDSVVENASKEDEFAMWVQKVHSEGIREA